MAELSSPLKIGDFELQNRLVMAPLTRTRSGKDRIPNELMREYYAQRGSAGMIIVEGTVVGPNAVGYDNTPGLWNEQHVAAWRKITDAVHAKGAKIVLQTWHACRISNSVFLNGKLPVAPSAIRPAGQMNLIRPKRPYETPRALTHLEIQAIVKEYRHSAELAKEAGFDAIDLHAANGYLVGQFLASSTNHREDEYGGSIENRARFLLQVLDELIDVWGAGRVGVHISPREDIHDLANDDPLATFSYLIEQLNKRHVAFVFSREFIGPDSLSPRLREAFNGVWISNEHLTPETAQKLLENGQADAVAFGKAYIANPDLYERLITHAPLNELETSTLYSDGAEGYTDYPALQD